LQDNLYDNEKENSFVCPIAQRMKFVLYKKCSSDNGYVTRLSFLYTATAKDALCADNAIRLKGKGYTG
jgi:hypothetical protein